MTIIGYSERRAHIQPAD